MAKPTWITTDKVKGNTSGSISISASPHTGREPRTGVVTIKNQMGTRPSKTVTVNQAAKPIFINTKSGLTDIIIPKAGFTTHIEFVTNSQTIALFNYITKEVICRVNGNIIQESSNTPTTRYPIIYQMSGQEGVAEEYTIDIEMIFKANEYAFEYTDDMYLSDSINSTFDDSLCHVALGQEACESTLSVLPESLALVTAGTAQTVAVNSNDDWDVL